MDHDGDFLHTAGDDPMIAVDIPRRRVYVRGNMHEAYSWLKERLYDNWADMIYRPFPIHWPNYDRPCEDHEWIASESWTIEHNPEEL